MEASSYALLALIIIVSLAFLSKILNKKHPKLNLIPPGPKPWPIIGNLNLIGSIPHQSLHFLSQTYGEIMQLKFGKFPVIVASSPEMARQFLKTHDSNFASRPVLAAGKYTGYNYSNMSWSPYGPHWRQARKIFSTEVFNEKKLESFKHITIEEERNFYSRLHGLSGKPVVIREHLYRYTLTSITRIVLSNNYFTESGKLDELKGLLDEWFYLNGVFNIGDWIPWLSFLDLQGYVKKMKVYYKKLDIFLNYVINDHLGRRKVEKDQFVPKDVVDVLLKLAEDPSLEVQLTQDRVKGLLQDLLAGGTDTSATAVEWIMLELMKQPNIIQKAKEELDKVVGRNRWVDENDFSRLPYIEAIIKESFRLHPIATFLAPHCAIEDCKVAGYNISKGTMIMINTWSIGRNPNYWNEPEKFLPERFIEKEIDLLGSNFALLPFGSGRRMCPGYKLGLKFVRIILTNLLHGFDWKLVEDMKVEDICFEEEYGLTTHPKVPLQIIMEPTLPKHLY